MEKTEKTSKQIVSLTWTIRDMEEQMKAEDDTFLKVSIILKWKHMNVIFTEIKIRFGFAECFFFFFALLFLYLQNFKNTLQRSVVFLF